MNNLEIRIVVEFLFDDDEEDNGPLDTAKITNYCEEVIPNYSDKQFQRHFRITRTTCEILLQRMFSTVGRRGQTVGNPELPLEKELLISLWYLSNLESFRGVADRFGISKSTAWSCLEKICNDLLILNTEHKIISLNRENFLRTMGSISNKTGLPGVVGIIDGSHIPIKAPVLHGASYINRKGYHSVVLQGVCDHNKRFIDTYAGEVGSMHDARVFRRSDFSNLINRINLPENQHFIGDSAYPLLMNVLVPYKDNGHLTVVQSNYNRIHAKSRIVIEHTFALLKGRFRRLKLIEAVRPHIICQIIIAACILHNLCIDAGDIIDINLHQLLDQERLIHPHVMYDVNQNDRRAANKRENIANNLFLRM